MKIYKAEKINWTQGSIARHNIPANANAFIQEARKGQNSNSNESLRALHFFTEVAPRVRRLWLGASP